MLLAGSARHTAPGTPCTSAAHLRLLPPKTHNSAQQAAPAGRVVLAGAAGRAVLAVLTEAATLQQWGGWRAGRHGEAQLIVKQPSYTAHWQDGCLGSGRPCTRPCLPQASATGQPQPGLASRSSRKPRGAAAPLASPPSRRHPPGEGSRRAGRSLLRGGRQGGVVSLDKPPVIYMQPINCCFAPPGSPAAAPGTNPPGRNHGCCRPPGLLRTGRPCILGLGIQLLLQLLRLIAKRRAQEGAAR